MRHTRRRPWYVFGACAATATAALTLVTIITIDLERDAQRTRARGDHEADIRLALWRMDAWLGPRMARETVRPYYEYQPFYAQPLAFDSTLTPVTDMRVLAPSPLVSHRSPIFLLHFEVDEHGRLNSPQLPDTQAQRALALIGLTPADDAASTRRDSVEDLLRVGELRDAEALAVHCEPGMEHGIPGLPQPDIVEEPDARRADAAAQADIHNRVRNAAQQTLAAQQCYLPPEKIGNVLAEQSADGLGAPAADAPSGVIVGSFVPAWITADGHDGLLLLREVRSPSGAWYQGILVDWSALAELLLAEIEDLFPRAQVRPAAQPDDDDRAVMLASLPVALLAGEAPRAAVAGGWSTPRVALGITWIAVLAALCAVGVTLYAAIALAERRSRFASAVTHELRTPLTTFTMYSDMLASGMTRDEQQKQVYLETLRDESVRLSRLVENVLTYARVEDRGARLHSEPVDLDELLAGMLPALEKRCATSECPLRVRSAVVSVTADREAVQQVIWNLIDNACKYARGQAIDLAVDEQGSAARMTVTDGGPGVPTESAAAIFRPFDRGARHEGDPTPGVGLGLAIARTLARDMGGDLSLNGANSPGAQFVFTLPRRPE